MSLSVTEIKRRFSSGMKSVGFSKIKNDTIGVVTSLTLQLVTDPNHAQNKHQQMPLGDSQSVWIQSYVTQDKSAITGLSGSMAGVENPDFKKNSR